MRMPDLTRFDFYAMRFTHSEAVTMMSAQEVGVYMLLLCRSWLMGKEASLPDNLQFLAREGRVSEVSQIVLDQFPVVETSLGPRRRNKTLHQVWIEAQARVELAAENGRRGNEKRWGSDRVATGSGSGGDSFGIANPSLNPTQSDPTQSDASQPEQHAGGSFKNLKRVYVAVIGSSPNGGKDAAVKYDDVCRKYGEGVVLDKFNAWAVDKKDWLQNNCRAGAGGGLRFFFEDLESLVEGDELREESKPKPTSELQLAFIDEQIAQTQREANERYEQSKKQQEWDEANKNVI